jgi:hypothetical protein
VQVGGALVVLGYYAGANATVAGGKCSALGPWVGGTAADILVQTTPSLQPIYSASDAQVCGLPTIKATAAGHQYLISATPASALVQAQPVTMITIGVPGLGYWFDGAQAGTRPILYQFATYYRVDAGTDFNTSVVVDAAQGAVAYPKYSGAGSTFRVRKADGTVATASGNAGATGAQGVTLLASKSGGGSGNSKVCLHAWVTGISNLDALLVSLGWT